MAFMRRDTRREELISLSMSICASISVCLGGGNTSDVVRPFYTTREWDEMQREMDDERQRVAQAQQIAKLRRMGR